MSPILLRKKVRNIAVLIHLYNNNGTDDLLVHYKEVLCAVLIPHLAQLSQVWCICSLPLSAGVPELGQFHAMSVMEWTKVTTTTGEQVELIRIRNPWGRRSWAGVWRERYAGGKNPEWSRTGPFIIYISINVLSTCFTAYLKGPCDFH